MCGTLYMYSKHTSLLSSSLTCALQGPCLTFMTLAHLCPPLPEGSLYSTGPGVPARWKEAPLHTLWAIPTPSTCLVHSRHQTFQINRLGIECPRIFKCSDVQLCKLLKISETIKYLIKDSMSKLGYSYKVECCVPTKNDVLLLWFPGAAGAPLAYCRSPGLQGFRNWMQSPPCQVPRSQSIEEMKIQISSSKASNPEQDQVFCLGEGRREKQGGQSRVLPPHIPSPVLQQHTSLSCFVPKTQVKKSHSLC